MAAPSAVAKDPWEFVVVRNRAHAQSPGDWTAQRTDAGRRGPGNCGVRRSARGRTTASCRTCCRIVPLRLKTCCWRAHALGLGACWLGVHPREDRVAHVRSLLAVPDDVIPVAIVSLGWPAESPAAAHAVPRGRGASRDLVEHRRR